MNARLTLLLRVAVTDNPGLLPGVQRLASMPGNASELPRNDPRQYDDLAGEWWKPDGTFAMLHWIAEARAALVPQAARPRSVLLDVGCGAGLLAPHVAGKGYRHVGVDITGSALIQALDHGVASVRGDALALPIASESADVVCAGEILEHVTDIDAAVAESCRVLRPGGLIVLDTIANTAAAHFLAVTVAENIRGGAPPGIHDPSLFVDRAKLVELYAHHGVRLQLRGLRPSLLSLLAWRTGRRRSGHMVTTRSTAVLFQAWGVRNDQ